MKGSVENLIGPTAFVRSQITIHLYPYKLASEYRAYIGHFGKVYSGGARPLYIENDAELYFFSVKLTLL